MDCNKKHIISVAVALLFVLYLQTGCTDNVHPQKSNNPSHSLEPDNITDADYYRHCLEKFTQLIKTPDNIQFFELEYVFNEADEYSESLLFNLVVSNRLGLDVAKIRVACCLSESLSNPNISKNSKEISLYYLKKWESSTQHKRGKQIIERFESIPTNETGIRFPKITYKSSEIQRLKVGCLKGVTKDYEKLKEKMSNDTMYAFMLYYAYIMADRYNYQPAKEDVITIIKRFYAEYNLGSLDKDTRYFCSFFE